ncbi:hypothetical protein PsorP6_012074 [Peronosclerospora sorghi]|uniref:Uncharacterized protein n=1 Tax=Peronosclerospora sorghi TaxID=230839 RepID=A0ACC0WJP6_9STRA|nr:hypothetical protein PsorP6_012074 [Peronosclerospora sorghi]
MLTTGCIHGASSVKSIDVHVHASLNQACNSLSCLGLGDVTIAIKFYAFAIAAWKKVCTVRSVVDFEQRRPPKKERNPILKAKEDSFILVLAIAMITLHRLRVAPVLWHLKTRLITTRQSKPSTRSGDHVPHKPRDEAGADPSVEHMRMQ